MDRNELKVYSDDYIHNVVEEQIAEDPCWRGKFILKKDAISVLNSMETQHKADAELIAADRRNMDAMKERIKELEKEVDAVKLNSGYTSFMAQVRIKELEEQNKSLEIRLENAMKIIGAVKIAMEGK